MDKKKKTGFPIVRPEWVPEDHSDAYTTNVMAGVAGGHDGLSQEQKPHTGQKLLKKRKRLEQQDYVKGILAKDRTILARTITLIESNAEPQQKLAQHVLTDLMPHSGNSIRVGITGVPGAGKSTFIEALGLYLIEKGYRVAVLAIDPSSTVTGGSILGDKTRMEKLSQHPQSFIRPSPSSGALGGVARKTRETMLVCEAAGYDVILVETVGVGQSEITVRSMVDFFLLVQIAGGGDELQGIKKGVMEIADAIVVNKADGENKPKAEAAKQDYAMALHYLPPATRGWETRAHTCSAITGDGIAELWRIVQKFIAITQANNVFADRRRLQARDWMRSMVEEYLQTLFYKHPQIRAELPALENAVMAGKTPATSAAQQLVQLFEKFKMI